MEVVMVERVCVICGAVFEKQGRRIVCSDSCKVARIAEKARERRYVSTAPLVKECIICGEKFEANRSAKTCGKDCSTKRQRLYQNHHKRANTWGHRETNARWRSNNPERYKKHCQDYRERHPDIEARRVLRHILGFDPTKELVEEYAALYLLNRAIKKAGEQPRLIFT